MDDDSKEPSIDCIVRKPVYLRVGDLSTEFKSGCAVVDVLFPGYNTVNVDRITFKNNYTASLEVKVKVREEDKSEVWKVCLKKLVLMPQAHYEAGSQSSVSITPDMMCCATDEVIMLRMILRQPSPHWAHFGIDNIKCYLPSTLCPSSSPLWLKLDNDESLAKSTQRGLPESENVAQLMQQMWAMTEEIKTAKTEQPIGRFEVDGSYDINLLSYT